MNRVYNFSAGPSMLPLEVLERAQKEMLDCNGSGQSVMEMSHRSKEYQAIIDEAEALFREIMNIPDNYKVMFLQGGASTQFSMVPLNLGNKNKKADYVITGQWAKKAYQEGQRYLEANAIASSADKTFSYLPKVDKSMLTEGADFVHITYNNTIYGTHYNTMPDFGDATVVTDMSSCILSEEGNSMDITPVMLKYDTHSENGSMYNTPPTYGIYICKLVYEWIKNMGGIAAMNDINVKKAKILYDYLDSSKMFKGTVVKEDRSLMNVPFVTGDAELDAKFVKAAEAAGFKNLKGHRSVGGMRASIYNAMPIEGVEALVEFMKKFEEENL